MSHQFMCVVVAGGLACAPFAFIGLLAQERTRFKADLQPTSQFVPIQRAAASPIVETEDATIFLDQPIGFEPRE